MVQQITDGVTDALAAQQHTQPPPDPADIIAAQQLQEQLDHMANATQASSTLQKQVSDLANTVKQIQAKLAPTITPSTTTWQPQSTNTQTPAWNNPYQPRNPYARRGCGRGRGYAPRTPAWQPYNPQWNPSPLPQWQARNQWQNPATTRPPNQPQLTKYCWTHGWCNHNGYECQRQAQGHQPAATAQNRMGGNPRNCFWINNPAA